ncbi:MAG: hypothetical protein LBN93_07640 [Candidatus Symbiothrix sp.]|jgi:tetratricopeptide (TPR) repeat protein|nr:hypothetical protein [Candidatus Symbiothrix sp.]
MLHFDDDFDDFDDFEHRFGDDFDGGYDDGDEEDDDDDMFSLGRPYPDFFYEWDEALEANMEPQRLFDSEELSDILSFYANDREENKLRKTAKYALKVYPDDEELLCDVMDVFEERGLWNDLLMLSQQYAHQGNVIADNNLLLSLLHLRMEEEAFVAFTKMKEYYTGEDQVTAIYLAMGDALADVDLFQSSIAIVNEGVKLFPDIQEFYWLNMESYWALGEKEKTFEMADKLTQLNALDAKFWKQLGDIYNKMEEHERAVEAFQFAESLGYDRNLNLLDMAKTYHDSANYIQALEALEEFTDDLSPNQILGQTFIPLLAAEMCAKLGQWERAIAYLDKSIAFSPDSELFYHSKAEALVHLKRYDEANSVLEEGLRMCQDEEGYLKNLLRKFKAGDYDLDRENYLDD